MAAVYQEFSTDYETMESNLEQCLQKLDSTNRRRINKNTNENVPYTTGLANISFGISKDEHLTKEEFAKWLNDVENILALNDVFLAYDHEELENFDQNKNYFMIRSRIYGFDIIPYCTIEKRSE